MLSSDLTRVLHKYHKQGLILLLLLFDIGSLNSQPALKGLVFIKQMFPMTRPVEAELSILLSKDNFHSKVVQDERGGGGTPRHFLKD